MRPRLLDLFCCAGGAAMGYHQAGFDVVGVDINPQPHYPFMFVQGDALDFLERNGRHFDVVHASPPCHDHSTLRHTMGGLHGTGWLLDATRQALRENSAPYVIENVPGAPMQQPIVLCGSMFGLGAQCGDDYRQLRRHRQFESNVALSVPSSCAHQGGAIGVYGGGRAVRVPGGRRGGYQGLKSERIEAMGIGWMTLAELSQAIPPAYTAHVGSQIIEQIGAVAA